MREAVVVDAIRTPVGRGRQGGALSGWHPADLLATTLQGLAERTGLDPALVDDVICGCVSQVGEQTYNVGRSAVLAAGWPEHVPATTVDRQCGSSQQAIHFAAQGIVAGAYDVVVAAGVEVMSRVPMGSSTQDKDPFGPGVAERYDGGVIPQGISAELIAARWGLGRDELDAYSAASHQRLATAMEEGRLNGELLPTPVDRGDGRDPDELLTVDEGLRPQTTIETLSALRPVFQDDAWERRYPEIDWVVHAGNASQLSDGAGAVLLMEKDTAERLGMRPRARVHATAVVGHDPILMLMGVVPATESVLQRGGLTLDDIDVFEVNEAFAPVVLAWQRETGADMAKVNVHGGAIANGHPLGTSGAKLAASLLTVLDSVGGRYGLQTMCEGGGMANALVLERVA